MACGKRNHRGHRMMQEQGDNLKNPMCVPFEPLLMLLAAGEELDAGEQARSHRTSRALRGLLRRDRAGKRSARAAGRKSQRARCGFAGELQSEPGRCFGPPGRARMVAATVWRIYSFGLAVSAAGMERCSAGDDWLFGWKPGTAAADSSTLRRRLQTLLPATRKFRRSLQT